MPDTQQDFNILLKNSGNSVTKVRIAVFQSLQNKEPQTMTQIVSSLPTIDRASVYRCIALFEELHVVQRLNIGWKYKLELTDQFHYHHHHITCKICGQTKPLEESSELEDTVRNLATGHGYTSLSHQIEITGICKQCS
jgi:Fe2+ or Zn2+ uptake regulation protein